SHAASALLTLAARPGVRPSHRDRALSVWVEAQLFRLNGYRGVAAAVRGAGGSGVSPDETASPASWTQRMQWGLLTRRMFETAAVLRGADALLHGGDGDDPWGTLLLASRGWTIGGGTTEIQRNMLGE